jgi:hypothetical protein
MGSARGRPGGAVRSKWTFQETAEGTEGTLDWRPSVNHALIKYLTPVLRPVFRSNHTWAMRRGKRQLGEYLASGPGAESG